MEACYRRCAPSLLTVAYRITASMEDSEDVVHDVFLGLPEALAHYQDSGRFEAWLTKVTVRAALMHRRRTERFAGDPAPLATLSTEQLERDPVVADRIQQALTQLTTPLRHVFVLRLVHEYAHAEIAGLLGISERTSEVRLHRALRKLRHLLHGLAS